MRSSRVSTEIEAPKLVFRTTSSIIPEAHGGRIFFVVGQRMTKSGIEFLLSQTLEMAY